MVSTLRRPFGLQIPKKFIKIVRGFAPDYFVFYLIIIKSIFENPILRDKLQQVSSEKMGTI